MVNPGFSIPLFAAGAALPPSWFDTFMNAIERHKDFADLALKAAGILLTLVGAVWVAVRFFADRRADRMKVELDLRRKAYFDYFTAIPLQHEALNAFGRDSDADEVKIPPETYQALFQLHLLASHDALECIIKRNAIFHEGVIDLVSMKRTAKQFQAVAEAGDKMAEGPTANWWETYRDRMKKLVLALSTNYRDILVFARREIGLKGDMAPILEALEKDEKAALAKWNKPDF